MLSNDFRPPEMSFINPLKKDVEFQYLVREVNDLADKLGADKIGNKVQSLAQAIMEKTATLPPTSGVGTSSETRVKDFRDQAVQQIKNEALRQEMRKRLGLLKDGDLVCDYSQGNPDKFEKGREACSCICGEAVQQFLSGQPIRTENEMYALMQRGIDSYNRFKFNGIVEFEETLANMNNERAGKGLPPLERVVPETISFMDPEFSAVLKADPSLAPLQGQVGEHIGQALEDLNRMSSSGKKVCGVLTCDGETIVVMFPKPGQPVLFDSHGRNYMGIPKGASLLQFNSTANLVKHMAENLFKPKRDFSLILLTTVEAKTPAAPPISRPVPTAPPPSAKPMKPMSEKELQQMAQAQQKLSEAQEYLERSIHQEKKTPLDVLAKACSKFDLNRQQAAALMEMNVLSEKDGALTPSLLEILKSADKGEAFIEDLKEGLNQLQREAFKLLIGLKK